MYLLTTTNELSNFFLGFGRKQRKDKGSKRAKYNTLTTSVKSKNKKFLYDSYGGDKAASELANNPNNKLNKKLAKQYLMDVAEAYDRDNYEGKDVNVGLNKVNKKYSKYFKK